MTPHQWTLLGTGALLVLLLLLGLSLQLGRRGVDRRAHHLLFFLVCAGVTVSAGLAWRAGAAAWALLPALTLLLRMPRTRPGRADHWQRALACAAAFLSGALLAWPLPLR
ncbi:hypothetical protein [Deinococcus depolymerans]|uniref:Uncharacterized protein n=1 Tax=Deinococcus depolymerans TaxID=392408 RepID=A0ABP3LM93_9DEIO